MRQSELIIHIVKEKYSEWLEMAGEQSPACKAALLADILASLLAKEMDEKTYYKQRLDEIERIKL